MLTHEEAGCLKAIQASVEPRLYHRRLIIYNNHYDGCGKPLLTKDGKAVLAEYDAEYVVVRRADARAVIEAHESGDCGNYFATEAANFRAALEAK